MTKTASPPFRGTPSNTLAAALLLFVLFLLRGSSAHEGHGTEEVGEFDLDAPRTLTPETAEHIGLKTDQVATAPLEEVLTITGVVRAAPDRHRAVAPRVPGRIVAVEKQVGDAVTKGEVVVRMESPALARNLYEARKLEVEYRQLLLQGEQRGAAIDSFAAEFELARAEVAYALAERDRARTLIGESVAQKELALREVELARAEGARKLKTIQLETARKERANLEEQAKALLLSRDALLLVTNIEPGTDLGSLTGSILLRAESDGIVVRRQGMPGRWVEEGETILETVDTSVVQVEGELPESLIPRVRQRESEAVRVRIPSEPGFVAEGVVRFLAPELDPEKRTAHLIVEVPNPRGLLLGEMWVDLSIVLRTRPSALVIPRTAVVVHGPMHFVFLQNGDAYQKQDIVPGWEDDRYVEVKRGLAPGDSIVVQGAYSLTHLRPKGGGK